jgi:hypothetical protein
MFRKVEIYNINLQKLLTFLYSRKEQSEKEIKKKNPITIASNKVVKGNLIKGIEDIYNENYKALKRELRKTLEDGKISIFVD